MEYCAGGSLSDLKDITKTNLNELEVRAVMASCILGLSHLHSMNNIHRDIKAGNILLTGEGKAKLADFGVSAQLTNSKNMRKTMIGTPFWMAPELIQETYYNGKADIWSLGITILELCEGHPPHFNVHPMRAIFMIPMKPAPKLEAPSKWSPQMVDFVERCLVKEVDNRWDSKALLRHEWIALDVESAEQGKGSEVLKRLVDDNWEAIEASRFNQNTSEGKDTDNDNDSDRTEPHGEANTDTTFTVELSESVVSERTPPRERMVSYHGSVVSNSTRGSTFNKSRPSSRRIKRHTTNSQSKSTTGERRNTCSSQLMETFQRIEAKDDLAGEDIEAEGTLRANTTLNGYFDAEEGVSTLKMHSNSLAGGIKKNSSKETRFNSLMYFQANNLNSTTNPSLVYDLLVLLGEGSYGRVYKGIHKFEHIEVAIKIIPCENQSDVTSEIEFLRKLKCPYIVSFVDGFLFEDELWIIMEYCAGGSLSDLREITKMNLTEAELQLTICYCILGLKHLHSLMSIHRDIKAGNILLTLDGRAKLADFGVSAQMQSATAKRRTVIGTPFWMAPEVIQETSYDSKADIWSLGITALELCEGHPPHFEVHPMRAIFLIPIKPAPKLQDPSQWSVEMNDFLSRCLVKEADSRASAAALSEHPWIASLAADVERDIHPPCLHNLVVANIETVYSVREARRSSAMKHGVMMKRFSVVDKVNSKSSSATSSTGAGGNQVDQDDHDGHFDGDSVNASSVATMELGAASRETSVCSEETVLAGEMGGDFDDDEEEDDEEDDESVDTFFMVTDGGGHEEGAIKETRSGEEMWFTVDAQRGSIISTEAETNALLGTAAESATSSCCLNSEDENTGTFHRTDDRAFGSKDAGDKTKYSSAKQFFNNLVTKQVQYSVDLYILQYVYGSFSLRRQDVLRQLAMLDQQYKIDKEKLEAKYQTNKSKLKLHLASFN